MIYIALKYQGYHAENVFIPWLRLIMDISRQYNFCTWVKAKVSMFHLISFSVDLFVAVLI